MGQNDSISNVFPKNWKYSFSHYTKQGLSVAFFQHVGSMQ